MITFYGQEFSELKTPYNIVVAADVLEFVQGLTEWISYIMMLKYGGEYSVAAKPSVRKNGNHLSG